MEILGDRECEIVSYKAASYPVRLDRSIRRMVLFNSQRKFVFEPVKDADIGKESPRAYIDYKHTKKPDPGYFKQILENSLNELEMAHFCEYLIHSTAQLPPQTTQGKSTVSGRRAEEWKNEPFYAHLAPDPSKIHCDDHYAKGVQQELSRRKHANNLPGRGTRQPDGSRWLENTDAGRANRPRPQV